MTPARGKLFVRPIETPESLPGGRIVLTESTREGLTAQQAEVVAVGEPAYCEEEACERPEVAHGWYFPDYDTSQRTHPSLVLMGAWVLLAPRCLVETDEPNLYVCAQEDVIARLEA